MPEDSDESTRAVITPTASLEDADGATVIQQPYGIVRRRVRDSQDDDDGSVGPILWTSKTRNRAPSRSPAILIVPQRSVNRRCRGRARPSASRGKRGMCARLSCSFFGRPRLLIPPIRFHPRTMTSNLLRCRLKFVGRLRRAAFLRQPSCCS